MDYYAEDGGQEQVDFYVISIIFLCALIWAYTGFKSQKFDLPC